MVQYASVFLSWREILCNKSGWHAACAGPWFRAFSTLYSLEVQTAVCVVSKSIVAWTFGPGRTCKGPGLGSDPVPNRKWAIFVWGPSNRQGWTCNGPGPGLDPVPNWKSGGPCNYVQKRQARSSYKKSRQGLAGLYSFTQEHARDISCMGFSFSNHVIRMLTLCTPPDQILIVHLPP